MKKLFLPFCLNLVLVTKLFAANFVQVKDGILVQNGKPYTFMGANFWQGMNLAAEAKTRPQLLRELDKMKSLGITQLRILALSEGPDSEPYRVVPTVQINPTTINESVLVGLDFLLSEMSKREMTAVVVLSNFWPWSGGMAQWVSWFEGSSIPYPPPHPGGSWSTFQDYSSKFYTIEKAVRAQQETVRKIITRVNTITRQKYSDDPTIMSWELANEPRGGKHRPEFLKWIKSSAKLIKSLDKNHLVTTGSEGDTLDPQNAGNNFIEDHSISEIDYATIHIWVENWGIYNPQNAQNTFANSQELMNKYIDEHVIKTQKFKKPVIIEEFGMARDSRSMDPSSATKMRDKYFESVFAKTVEKMKDNFVVSGVNFWAWSGEGRPKKPYGGLWRAGDDILGDPPHEEQGWYGVYDSDLTTLKIIESYAKQMKR